MDGSLVHELKSIDIIGFGKLVQLGKVSEAFAIDPNYYEGSRQTFVFRFVLFDILVFGTGHYDLDSYNQ